MMRPPRMRAVGSRGNRDKEFILLGFYRHAGLSTISAVIYKALLKRFVIQLAKHYTNPVSKKC